MKGSTWCVRCSFHSVTAIHMNYQKKNLDMARLEPASPRRTGAEGITDPLWSVIARYQPQSLLLVRPWHIKGGRLYH
jgi:hypothetical protein